MASSLQKQVSNIITQSLKNTTSSIKTTQQTVTNKTQTSLTNTKNTVNNTVNAGTSTTTNSTQKTTSKNNTTTKATNTTVKVLSNGGEVTTIDLGAYVGQEYTPTKATNKDLVAFIRTNFQGQIADGVDLLINKSIDRIVEDQIGLKTKELAKTDVGLLYQEGKSVYERILKSEQTLLQLRGTYTRGITDSVDKTINGALNNLGNKGIGGVVRNFLIQSKLAEAVTGSINLMVTETIKAVADDQMIKNVSKQMIDTVKKIKNESLKTLKTTFKNQIEYVNKLKKAIKDKFEAFEKAKAKMLEKITNYINDINKKISEYLTKVTKAITEKVASLVAGAVSGLTGGLSF